jgi:hypothetical protein
MPKYADVALRLLRVAYRKLLRPRRWSYPSRILNESDGNHGLRLAIESVRPFAAGRLGSVELNSLERFLRISDRARRYDAKLRHDMSNSAGFFPIDDESLDSFAAEYGLAVSKLDYLGVWFNLHEDFVIKRFCPEARLISLRALEPYYHEQPWSAALAGRNVLVVHPFAKSIHASYTEARSLLFSDPAVLPAFNLMILPAVQSQAGAISGFPTWFRALSWMKEKIAEADFDICLVGAGAYGLPLAAFVKSLGKQAIHMGGATQVLFGIIGRRWERHPVIGPMINQHWRRPSASEVPPGAMSVEGGCYW